MLKMFFMFNVQDKNSLKKLTEDQLALNPEALMLESEVKVKRTNPELAIKKGLVGYVPESAASS
jgi:hypothetical protein